MASHDQCNSGNDVPAHFMSGNFDDPSTLSNYLVLGQQMQPNQGGDFPSMSSLNENDTTAMLDQSSSATVSVPSTITSGITDSLPVNSINTIGTDEMTQNITPFTPTKAVNNGHTDSSHFVANNCTNQVILGQK